MLAHIIVKSQLNKPISGLTYNTKGARPGQLVLINLRGRNIPGIVEKINAQAGTTGKIKPIKQLGEALVPESFLKTIQLLSDYYLVSPSTMLAQIAPALNQKYLTIKSELISSNQEYHQECYIIPSDQTLYAKLLVHQTVPIAKTAAARRAQWQQALSGSPLRVRGTQAALFLPYHKLSRLSLDTPFAAPYQNQRAPGLNTAVAAALVAQANHAQLIVRSPLPLSKLQLRFPFPANTQVRAPKLNSITTFQLKDRPVINRELIANIQQDLKNKRRVLIYYNFLPSISQHTGQVLGIARLKLQLEKQLQQPIKLCTKNSTQLSPDQISSHHPNYPLVTLATAAALYRQLPTFHRTYLLNLEDLISTNQPWSTLAAIETLAVLASRNDLYVQSSNTQHLLTQACLNQLEPAYLETIKMPTFNHRIIGFSFRKPSPPTKILREINRQFPDHTFITPSVQHSHPEIIALCPKKIDKTIRDLIIHAGSYFKVSTDKNSLI